MYYTQSGFDITCEWGSGGIAHLADGCAVVVIIDVLSFSTCVDVAVGREAEVYPLAPGTCDPEEFAASIGGVAARRRREKEGYSLSPASLLRVPSGTRLVLPSPNGSLLTTMVPEGKAVFAACLRNAEAVARAVIRAGGGQVLVVPAGERWPDGSLRPALEDTLGAGAVIHALRGSKSPEALAAESAYLRAVGTMEQTLLDSVSGRELIVRGYEEDVRLAAQVNVSRAAPRLVGGRYTACNE